MTFTNISRLGIGTFALLIAGSILSPSAAEAKSPKSLKGQKLANRMQQGPSRLLIPGFPVQQPPRLGIYGYMLYGGRGMRVSQVLFGTPAMRAGLEPGDVILKINNIRIRSHYDFRRALLYSGGMVRMLVRDVRGRGLIWTRTVYLDGGQSPILYNMPRR